MSHSRRKFLRSASVATIGALAITAAPNMVMAVDNDALVKARMLMLEVRGTLDAPATSIDLEPGELSEVIDLGSKGIIRVHCTPIQWNHKFGRLVYRLIVADRNGIEMARMNIGSNTTATFESLGIQIYMLALEQAV